MTDTPNTTRQASQQASQASQQTPATLGDVLYAKSDAPVPEQDWAALVGSLAAGDQLALPALYERACRPVFTLLLRITANPEIAEELTIEVFHDVRRNAPYYDRETGSVLGWIMNLARARAMDRLRLEGQKKRSHNATKPPSSTEAIADARDVLDLRAQTASLSAALAVLTPEERRAIEATYFAGLTHMDAAARLNQPPEAIKMRIRSALHKLRNALASKTGET